MQQSRIMLFKSFSERSACRRSVVWKLKDYTETDIMERNKRGTNPTIEIEEAMIMLENSGGVCSCCGCYLIMCNWPAKPENVPTVMVENGYERQYSFDRINNNDTHNSRNLRITCLLCNIRNADAIHKPNYQIRSENTSYAVWEEYELIKQCFNRLEKFCVRGKNPDYVEREVLEKHLELKGYMYWLHDLMYEDRKINNWLKHGGVIRTVLPKPLPKPLTEYNNEYYLRERLGITQAKIDAEEQLAYLRSLCSLRTSATLRRASHSSLGASACLQMSYLSGSEAPNGTK
jgi:hypothetical protein